MYLSCFRILYSHAMNTNCRIEIKENKCDVKDRKKENTNKQKGTKVSWKFKSSKFSYGKPDLNFLMENLISVVRNICEITKNVQMLSFLQDINYEGPNHEQCKKQLELMEKHGLTEGPLYKVLQFRLTQVPARGEIKNENIDIHPYKKPKIDMDVKPKVEADIKIKTEPIEEFNRSIEIITNMNVPARPQVCNIGYDLFQLLKTEKTNSLSVKGFFWTRKYL